MKISIRMSTYVVPFIAVMVTINPVCLAQKTNLPEPIALYPLSKQYGTQDISIGKNPPGKAVGVELSTGHYGQPAGSYYFSGSPTSFIEFPNNGGLDARYSITLVAWIYPEDSKGPIFNYKVNGRGVYLWLESPNKLTAKFEKRNSSIPYGDHSDRIRLKAWNYIAASYDNATGAAKLWIDGEEVSSLTVGSIELETRGDVRMGAVVGEPHSFKGRVSCMQVYGQPLTKHEIEAVRDRCPVQVQYRNVGCYSDKSPPAITSLEAKDSLLSDDPRSRQDSVQKCARVALKLGYAFYAIQDGGHCFSSLTAQNTYNRYGLSTECQEGKGGKMASDVYEIVMFRDQTCWNGWVAHEDACYRLYGDQKTWAEALSFCQAKRSSLATLNSEDKTYFAFLQVIKPARLKSNVWIGLSRDLEGKFHWPDSSLMEYSNWSPGNPDSDQRTKKNCTAMNVYSGLWEDEEFDYTHSFLCGRAIPAMPRDLRVKVMDSHSALVTWKATSKSQQGVTSYYVEYGVQVVGDVHLKIVHNQNSCSLAGLQPNAEYHLRVRSVNGAGGGVWSHYKTFATGKTYPPRIHTLPTVKAQLPGKTLEINCTSQGGPKPTITWYKDQAFLQEGHSLVVRNMTSEKHGLYTCKASNGIEPDDIKSVVVTSLAHPVLTHMWGAATEAEIYMDEGESLSLMCELNNLTVATVQWFKDEEPLGEPRYSQLTGNVITIRKITGNDFGVYECQASNALGMASKKIRVVNASRVTALKAAIGCMAALSILLFIVVAVLTWLLLKARRSTTAKDKDYLDGERPSKPRGPRPSDGDFMVGTGNTGVISKGSNSSYSPLKTVSSNGGTSTFKPNSAKAFV